MVKATLSEVPRRPLSHLTSLCSYPRPALPPHTQRRGQVHPSSHTNWFGFQYPPVSLRITPFPYTCNSIFTSVISSGYNYVPMSSIIMWSWPQACHSPPQIWFSSCRSSLDVCTNGSLQPAADPAHRTWLLLKVLVSRLLPTSLPHQIYTLCGPHSFPRLSDTWQCQTLPIYDPLLPRISEQPNFLVLLCLLRDFLVSFSLSCAWHNLEESIQNSFLFPFSLIAPRSPSSLQSRRVGKLCFQSSSVPWTPNWHCQHWAALCGTRNDALVS